MNVFESIPADPFRWTVKPRGASQLAARLVEQFDEALRFRQLAALVDTVPLEASLEDVRFRDVPHGRSTNWCDELGVPRLKTFPRRWQ